MATAEYLDLNKAYYTKRYEEGYGLNYPDSHVIRIYHKVMKAEFDLDGSKGEKIFDFGCGTGAHALYFKSQGFDVYGSDIDENAISKCKAVMDETASQYVATSTDADEIPFPDQKFDVIFTNQVLYYFSATDLGKKCQILKSQLKPGGLFIATMMGTGHYYHGRSEEFSDGLRKITLDGRIKGVNCINFTESDEDCEKKFHMFKKVHIGFYDHVMREDEGRAHHYIYIGKNDG